jgi:hypothetical protein
VCPRKERKKSLTRGHVEDIGSTMGIQIYEYVPQNVLSNARIVLANKDGSLEFCRFAAGFA